MAQLFGRRGVLLRSAKALAEVYTLEPAKGLFLQFRHRPADVATSAYGRLSLGRNTSTGAPRSEGHRVGTTMQPRLSSNASKQLRVERINVLSD